MIIPVDITAGIIGLWQEVDVSGIVPVGTTGAILHVTNTGGSDYRFGCRDGASLDSGSLIRDMYRETHTWAMTKVDANRKFEVFIENVAVNVYLVGYTTAGVTMFLNPVSDHILLGTGGDVWTEKDVSAACPGAKAIILLFTGSDTNWYNLGARCAGQSDPDRHASARGFGCHTFIVGCDTDQLIDVLSASVNLKIFILGYITDGVTMNLDATDKSLGGTGSFIDINCGAGEAAFVEVVSNATLSYALRENGSAEDIYYDTSIHAFAIIEMAGSLIEGKIEDTGVDFWLHGVAEGVPVVGGGGSQASGLVQSGLI